MTYDQAKLIIMLNTTTLVCYVCGRGISLPDPKEDSEVFDLMYQRSSAAVEVPCSAGCGRYWWCDRVTGWPERQHYGWLWSSYYRVN